MPMCFGVCAVPCLFAWSLNTAGHHFARSRLLSPLIRLLQELGVVKNFKSFTQCSSERSSRKIQCNQRSIKGPRSPRSQEAVWMMCRLTSWRADEAWTSMQVLHTSAGLSRRAIVTARRECFVSTLLPVYTFFKELSGPKCRRPSPSP